ncbi:non-ribosomal peptide synthetase [Maridesulfovibrio sp.]|uniref:non-ribosomal peptide synthetase n=1 Tax=Maridesulfovibrio sp. TaxID=2795000 RepID=UPI003BA92435
MKKNMFDQKLCDRHSSPSLLQRFNHIVERHSQQTACVFNDYSLSYMELDKASDAMARILQAQGLGPEKSIGVLLERSPEVIVAFLAAAKAGIPYVPLAPDWPEQRSSNILKRCNAPLVLIAPCDRQNKNGYCGLPTLPVSISTKSPIESVESPERHAEELPLYILHTSGSTGQPKGVVVSHANVLHYATNFCHEALLPGARVAFCAALTFDATVLEIWGSLLNGCTIVGGKTSDILDAARCKDFLKKNNVNSLFLATAALNALALQDPHVFASLDYLFMGGEKPTMEILHAVFAATPPKHFYHCYGPTETTVIISKKLVKEVAKNTESLSVGNAIGQTFINIYDNNGAPLPPGGTGEVVLGGPTVSMGYLNDTERTARSFIPDHDNPGKTLYRTGDLGWLTPQGELTLLGRIDDQVKISGYRVNLGEICSTIELIPEVATAHVGVIHNPGPEPVAYVVSKPKSGLTKISLNKFIAKRLPKYMLPNHVIFLPEMPLNANGKVDKNRLPDPLINISEQSDSDTVLDLFRQTLGSTNFQSGDSFLAHGGSSLKAASLIVSIRNTTGIMIPLDLFYQPRTVEGIEMFISLAAEKTTPLSSPQNSNAYDEVII